MSNWRDPVDDDFSHRDKLRERNGYFDTELRLRKLHIFLIVSILVILTNSFLAIYFTLSLEQRVSEALSVQALEISNQKKAVESLLSEIKKLSDAR